MLLWIVMGRPSVCPCEPSGLAVLGKDYGFVSVNSFLLCKTTVHMGETVGKESHSDGFCIRRGCNISRIDVAPPTINGPLKIYHF